MSARPRLWHVQIEKTVRADLVILADTPEAAAEVAREHEEDALDDADLLDTGGPDHTTPREITSRSEAKAIGYADDNLVYHTGGQDYYLGPLLSEIEERITQQTREAEALQDRGRSDPSPYVG